MAEKILEADGIIQPDIFKDTRESAEKTLPVLKDIQAVFSSILSNTKNGAKSNMFTSVEDIENFNRSVTLANETVKAKLKIDQDIIKTQAQILAATEAETQAITAEKVALEQNRLARNELNKTAEKTAIIAKAQEGSLEQYKFTSENKKNIK